LARVVATGVEVTIPFVGLDRDRLNSAGCFFPSSITDDPWIAFHGTSGAFEDEIERDGL
jgi:hypothetical protein